MSVVTASSEMPLHDSTSGDTLAEMQTCLLDRGVRKAFACRIIESPCGRVDQQGGSVEVESEVGTGSRFTINLPCKTEDSSAQEILITSAETTRIEEMQRRKVSQATSGPRDVILLAEDNMPNVLTFGDYLESQGYEVLVAHDGMEIKLELSCLNFRKIQNVVD